MASEFEQILDEMQAQMRDPQTTQKANIIRAAEALEKQNFDLDSICRRVIEGIKSKKIPIKPEYVRKVLPEKYKEVENIRKDILAARAEGGNQTDEQRNSSLRLVYGSEDDEDYSNYEEQETPKSRQERLKRQREEYSPGAKYYRTAMKVTGGSGGKTQSHKKQEEEGFEDDTDTDEIKRKNSKLRGLIVEQEQEIAQLQGVIKQRDERIVKLEQEVEYWKAGR